MDEEKYELLKKEVDSLQIQLAQGRGPWYTKPSVLISVFALLFSFGTTAVSAWNSHLEDIRENRREARTLIQRMTKLPIENYDLMKKHEGRGSGQALSGMINQENILLATQTSELLERYPDSFSSTEYFAVASALMNSNRTGKVADLFEQAIRRAHSSSDYNVAARAYAYYLYSRGDIDGGRANYEESLEAWNKFPDQTNDYVINSTILVTRMYWSLAEAAVNNFEEARTQIGNAKDRLRMLAPGPYTESLSNQISEAEMQLEQAEAQARQTYR